MTKKQSLIFFSVGALFTLILGTIGHFFYEWSGENPLTGIFFPVNESVWEHMKLALFPTFLYLGIASFKIRKGNYIAAWFIALIVGAGLIPLLFYSYTYFVGRSYLPADIAVFFISVIAGYAFAFFVYNSKPRKPVTFLAAAGIAVIAACFLTFTLCPPDFILFKEP